MVARPSFASVLLGFGVLTACLVGCAKGEEVPDDGAGGAGGGTTSATSATTAAATTSGGTTAAATTSGDGGENMGGSGTTATTTGVVNCDFSTNDDCETAEPLMEMAGDKDDSHTESHLGSRWYALHVTEQDNGIGGEDFSYRVTLTSPASAQYQLVVYRGAESGPIDCTTEEMGSGNPQILTHSWGDDLGEDDSKWIVIGVLYQSGDPMACTAADNWNLLIETHI
jgi:hypothetical protein